MLVSEMTDEQLRNLIANHQKHRAFDQPVYTEALEELQRREGPSLTLDTTIKRILASAAAGEFLTYGDVAKANGCEWVKVRRQMPRHLDRVLAKAHARQAPLITAIVVNEGDRKTGELKESSLSGFIAGAERLGLQISNPNTFLLEQQQATFRYAVDHRTL